MLLWNLKLVKAGFGEAKMGKLKIFYKQIRKKEGGKGGEERCGCVQSKTFKREGSYE